MFKALERRQVGTGICRDKCANKYRAHNQQQHLRDLPKRQVEMVDANEHVGRLVTAFETVLTSKFAKSTPPTQPMALPIAP